MYHIKKHFLWVFCLFWIWLSVFPVPCDIRVLYVCAYWCVGVCCTWVEESASYIHCRRYRWHRLDKWFQLKCKDCRSCYHSVHATSTNITLNILHYGQSDAILATACAGCIFSWICSRLTIRAIVTFAWILPCDFIYKCNHMCITQLHGARSTFNFILLSGTVYRISSNRMDQ